MATRAVATTPAQNSEITAIGVVAPPPILISTGTFEGSLATLFRCVREHKVDLMEVPLHAVCEAYFEYILTADGTNLDEAAAALSVLSYLLERKAWQLLPVPESEEPEADEPAELPEATAHEYAEIIEIMRQWQEERNGLFFRSPGSQGCAYELPYAIKNVEIRDLARALERLLRNAEPDSIELLSKPRKSLQEQMKIVLLCLTKEPKRLEEMFVGTYTRSDAVYWFLALLELIRLQKAKVDVQCEEVLFSLP